MRYLIIVGRWLYSVIFILASFGHFKAQTIGYAASQGVPLASLAVPLSGVMAILGGLSIAANYKTKWGAWLIVLFLVPVTVMMHRFWGLSDPQAAMMQQIMFMKNISMLGAALVFTQVGIGTRERENSRS